MEIWVLSFVNADSGEHAIGTYSSYELTVEAMRQDYKINDFNNLDSIEKWPQWGKATCWCDEGLYIFSRHILDKMPQD